MLEYCTVETAAPIIKNIIEWRIQSTENISDIYVINQLGEIVYKEASVNYNTKELDLTNLSNGMYFYKIISDSKAISNGKLIIAH